MVAANDSSSMSEVEKLDAGLVYDFWDPGVVARKVEAVKRYNRLNAIPLLDVEARDAAIRELFGSVGANPVVMPIFNCDNGKNIHVGENFYANHGLIILDGAPVTFGDNVFIAPNCVFSTAGHPIDAPTRNEGLEYALPITVGNDVWFGMGVMVCPVVTIGSNVVIGAGSVVNKDIPSGVVAEGNPCRPIRKITDEDAARYQRFSPE